MPPDTALPNPAPEPEASPAPPAPAAATPGIATPEIDSSGKSRYLKFVIVAAILIVVGIVGVVVYNKFALQQTQEASVTTPPDQQAPAPSLAPQAAIDTDLQAVNSNLNNLDSDLSSINAGLTDQQGDLTEK